MKKIFILASLLMSTPLWAQYYTQTTTNLNTLQSSATNIAPGVSIITPYGTVGMNPYNTSNASGNNVAPGAIPVLNENTGAVTIPAPKPLVLPGNTQNNSQNTLPNNPNNTVNNTPPMNQMPVNQPVISAAPVVVKPAPKPAVVNGNISDWNKTTQQEIELKAQADLEQKYKDFLYKR